MVLAAMLVLGLALGCHALPMNEAGTMVNRGSPEDFVDSTTDPCQDFYRYACGGWLDQNQLPSWSSRYGKSFTEVSIGNLAVIKPFLEGQGNNYASLTKARTIYATCMDLQAIEQLGDAPVQLLISSSGGWSVLDPNAKKDQRSFDLVAAMVSASPATISSLFKMFVDVDPKDSSSNIIQFYQSGLGMKAREVYLGGYESLVAAYVDFGVAVAKLVAADSGMDTAQTGFMEHVRQSVTDVVNFERQLAQIMIPNSDLRDFVKTYHKMSIKDFNNVIPEFDMHAYLQGKFETDIPLSENVLVPTLAYFPALNQLLQETPSSTVQNYVVLGSLLSSVQFLPQRYRDARLAFDRVFRGISDEKPRWIDCASAADALMGFVTGAEFVQALGSTSIKNEVTGMIHSLQQEFVDSLPSVNWIQASTRAKAIEKASASTNKVVAPSWVLDSTKLDAYYATLSVDPSSYFFTVSAASSFGYVQMLARRGAPVDHNEWIIGPAVVNAYHYPHYNEMVFTAGILRPPFFDPAMQTALKYASIGWVIGHELIHGFDDLGRTFDAQGNLNNWWDSQSEQAYLTRAQCIRQQYGGYSVNGMALNGELTLGENIADNGGLRLAYRTYQNEVARWAGHERLRVRGERAVTTDQLFFLGAAQIWCRHMTSEETLLRILNDDHSTGRYRVIGTMSNMEEFSQAFQCAPGTAMNPVNKCRVW